jgi:hypothetical protein
MSVMIFPNLFDNRTAFKFHTSSSDLFDQAYHASGMILSNHAGWFETYGDGTVQHSSEMVCGAERCQEWCLSFADYLVKNFTQIELSAVPLGLPVVAPEKVRFLCSLRYRDDKRQFYNLSDLKVSSSDSKRYDKRWLQVPAFADERLDSAIKMYWADHCQRQFVIRYHVMRQFLDHCGYYTTTEEAKMLEQAAASPRYAEAFEAMRLAIEAVETYSEAKRRTHNSITTINEAAAAAAEPIAQAA